MTEQGRLDRGGRRVDHGHRGSSSGSTPCDGGVAARGSTPGGPRTGTGRRPGCAAGTGRRPSAPSTVTSPGPMPAKHTCLPNRPHSSAPACTPRLADPEVGQGRHPGLAEPGERPADVVDPPGIVAGMSTSIHTEPPGSSSTAPPPLRRRATLDAVGREPLERRPCSAAGSSRAPAPARRPRAATPSARTGSGQSSAWRSAAGPRRRSTTQPPVMRSPHGRRRSRSTATSASRSGRGATPMPGPSGGRMRPSGPARSAR